MQISNIFIEFLTIKSCILNFFMKKKHLQYLFATCDIRVIANFITFTQIYIQRSNVRSLRQNEKFPLFHCINRASRKFLAGFWSPLPLQKRQSGAFLSNLSHFDFAIIDTSPTNVQEVRTSTGT